MLRGGRFTGLKVNIPYLEYNFVDDGLTSEQVDIQLQAINAVHTTELTWRIIDVRGNDPITDETTYNELIDKGFEIYGDTDFL